MKKIISIVFIIASLFAVSSCVSDKGETEATLAPTFTHAIDENEKQSSEITIDGFKIAVYKTYASILGYVGSDTKLVIPDSAAGVPVRVIGESAFDGNEKIASVTFGKNIWSVYRYAFRGTSSLKIVKLNSGLEIIGDWCFQNSGIEKCDFPETLATIGKYAFRYTNLENVVLPSSLDMAGKYAFADCPKLRSVLIPKRFTEIAERMFSNCAALEMNCLPKTVKKIDNYAFQGCASIKTLQILCADAKIGEGAFFECEGITLFGTKGSTAEMYAKNNNITFEIVDEPVENGD